MQLHMHQVIIIHVQLGLQHTIYIPLQSFKFVSNTRPGGQAHLYPSGLVELSRQMWLQLFPRQLFDAA